MILLNTTDTLIRALTRHLATTLQIMEITSILHIKERMGPGGEAEAEAGEKGIEAEMGVSVAPAPGGRDLEATMGRPVAATGTWAGTTQVHIPWTDLIGQTGEEMSRVEI